MKKIFVITGPTASGKTALAIDLAKKINGEIICADSRIVYKDLDIVSAKPSIEERQGVIHHLIDIKSPIEGIYSAGEFVRNSREIINNSNSPLIIQGGTWFYIKTLFDDKELIEFGQNPSLRKKLEKFSNDELYEILLEKDEKRASIVHKNNRDKVIRSIELIEAIGCKISEYKRLDTEKLEAKWLMPHIERDELYKRINKRVDDMLQAGLYQEWQRNYEKYGKSEILYNTIGYKEFFDLEDGVYENFEVAVDKIKQHTRNFAKRQLTWFRQNIEKFNIEEVFL